MTMLRQLLGRSMTYSMLVDAVERCHREGARLEIRAATHALGGSAALVGMKESGGS